MDEHIEPMGLAALRPGQPGDALAAAMGSRWRPPAPHAEGWVRTLSRSRGFEARLDTAGRIGALRFRHAFPSNAAILGLRLGMSIDEARARQSGLSLDGIRKKWGEVGAVRAALETDGYRVMVEFFDGKLTGIELSRSDAAYPTKPPTTYPAPAGASGAPFGETTSSLSFCRRCLNAMLSISGSRAN